MTPTAMIRYSAGPWLGLARGRSLVALPSDASEETAAVLWDLLAGDPGVERLLSTVLSGRLDLTGMPAFAIVSFVGHNVHAILRGDVHLRMTGLDDNETQLSGTGVSTWNERMVPGVRSFELLVDDALPNAENLPLEAGAVRLAALQADLMTPGDSEPCPEIAETTKDRGAAGPEVVAPPEPDPTAASTAEAENDVEADSGTVPEAGPEVEREPRPDQEPVVEPEPEVEPGPEPGPAPDSGVNDDDEVNDDEIIPGTDDQSDGVADIDMTIAPDVTEYTTSHSAPESQQPSGRTTRVQPADEASVDTPEGELDDSTIAGPPPTVAAPEPPRPAAVVPGPQELIDSVPWLAAARRAVSEPERPSADTATEHAAGGPDLTEEVPADLGQTVVPEAHPDDDANADTVLSPSAVAPPAGPMPAAGTPAPPSGSPKTVPADPDHDGQTVMKSDLDLTGVENPAPVAPIAPAAAVPPMTGPMVLARQCSDGHANPPTASTCTVCGQSLGGEARQVRRPSLGRIRMSTGEVLDLDRPAVIGRQPQAHRVGSGTMPRMIQVRSPNGDISRSHCEVVLEGWHVQLRDLKATNGTVLIREGAAPRRLGQSESVMVLDGDIADLGDGVSLRFEAIP